MSERVYKSSQKARDKANAWYLANKERALAKNKAYRLEIRRMSNEAKSQPCQRCGGEFPIYVMEFHHRDPSLKKGEIANMPTPNLAQKEIDKCDVLCANCHRIVEYENGRRTEDNSRYHQSDDEEFEGTTIP